MIVTWNYSKIISYFKRIFDDISCALESSVV